MHIKYAYLQKICSFLSAPPQPPVKIIDITKCLRFEATKQYVVINSIRPDFSALFLFHTYWITSPILAAVYTSCCQTHLEGTIRKLNKLFSRTVNNHSTTAFHNPLLSL